MGRIFYPDTPRYFNRLCCQSRACNIFKWNDLIFFSEGLIKTSADTLRYLSQRVRVSPMVDRYIASAFKAIWEPIIGPFYGIACPAAYFSSALSPRRSSAAQKKS